MKVGKSSRGVKIKCEGEEYGKGEQEESRKRGGGGGEGGGGERRIEIKGTGGGESFAGKKKAARKLSVIMEDENEILE